MLKPNKQLNNRTNKILRDCLLIALFLFVSYWIISSKYNFVMGDAGTYAFKTKLLYEKNLIDVKEQSAISLGQILFGYIFSIILGFSLKSLHISVYCAVFLCMIAFYFLLLQYGADRFIALIGAFALFINPITLQFIDWYMTEPYFLFYFFLAINLFVIGFKSEKARYFYLGSIFSTIALFTRQFAISLSIALIALLLMQRKRLKHNAVPIIISSVIPIVSMAVFYLASPNVGDTKKLYAARILFMKRLLNPLNFILYLSRDALYTLHYSGIYLLPIIIILLVSAFIKKEHFKKLVGRKGIPSLISLIVMFIGTMIFYCSQKKLMPYLPSIFSTGAITRFFGTVVFTDKTASIVLTIFSTIGGIIILSQILEYVNWNEFKRVLLGRCTETKDTTSRYYIYLVGFFFFLLNFLTFLMYDRYIFPVSIFILFFLLLNCPWIASLKKTAIITLLIIYVLFILNLKCHRLREEITWDAGELLMEKGIKPIEINLGCGFGFYHNFYQINELYKNENAGRPVNWHKFHPAANYFISTNRKLVRHPGLELVYNQKKETLLSMCTCEAYIFKRKTGYKKAIWIR